MAETQLKVLILGSGPSAAYAYRACRDMGLTPRVMANTDPTRTRGAFWLNWMPSSIEPHVRKWNIHISSVGTPDIYMMKQWQGQFRDAPNSFPKHPKTVRIYDPKDGLLFLWEGVEIEPCGWLTDLYIAELAQENDLVIQTFPTEASKHLQPIGKVWVVSFQDFGTSRENGYCIYNGSATDPQTRWTDAFGELNVEFGDEAQAHRYRGEHAPGHMIRRTSIYWYPNLRPDTEPMDVHNVSNVLLTGRFARWDRRELAQDSYQRTLDKLASLCTGVNRGGVL